MGGEGAGVDVRPPICSNWGTRGEAGNIVCKGAFSRLQRHYPRLKNLLWRTRSKIENCYELMGEKGQLLFVSNRFACGIDSLFHKRSFSKSTAP